MLDWGPSGQLKKIYLMAEPPSGSPSCSPAMPVPLATEVETQEPSLEKNADVKHDSAGALLDHKDIIEATKAA